MSNKLVVADVSNALLPAAGFASLSSRATKTSLRLGDCSFEEYEEIGRSLATIGPAEGFWIGDFFMEGLRLFGEDKILPVILLFGDAPVALSTVEVKASVCRAFPVERRIYNLSYSHYRATLPIVERMRERVLEEAEANGWSVAQVEDTVKQIKQREQVPLPKTTSPRGEVEKRKDSTPASGVAAGVIDVTSSLRDDVATPVEANLIAGTVVTAGVSVPPSVVPPGHIQEDDDEPVLDTGDYYHLIVRTLTVREVAHLIGRLQRWVAQRVPGAVQADEFVA